MSEGNGEGLKPIEASLAHIVTMHRDTDYQWRTMMGEWIDNSFGADSTRVEFDREKSTVKVIDNGQGCADIYKMVNIGDSHITASNRAGRYGVGGKISQICATRAGRVEIETTTNDKFGLLVVDWDRVIRTGDPRPIKHVVRSRPPGLRRGTTITLHDARRWHDVAKLVRDLGYDYALELKAGKTIHLRQNGDVTRIKPYTPPAFSRQVEFNLTVDGHLVRGFTGLVAPGVANPYHGWSFHWGYRVLSRSSDPADGRPTHRIYGEVLLPGEWANITPTKNGFNERPDALFDAIAEACRDIIEEAEQEAYDLELSTASREAEAIISDVLKECGRRRIKGRRPGETGEEGTVEPTGDGSPHRQFTTFQDGDKAEADQESEAILAKVPDRIRIVWDETLETVYTIDASGRNGRTMSVALNASMPLVHHLKNDALSLAMNVLTIVSHEVSINQSHYQKMFPTITEWEFQRVLNTLIGRVKTQASVTA